jgi:hypothetical protein
MQLLQVHSKRVIDLKDFQVIVMNIKININR